MIEKTVTIPGHITPPNVLRNPDSYSNSWNEYISNVVISHSEHGNSFCTTYITILSSTFGIVVIFFRGCVPSVRHLASWDTGQKDMQLFKVPASPGKFRVIKIPVERAVVYIGEITHFYQYEQPQNCNALLNLNTGVFTIIIILLDHYICFNWGPT